MSHSRRDTSGPSGGQPPRPQKPQKPKKKHPILSGFFKFIAVMLCIGIMAGSALTVGAVYYVVQATANDGDLLDLDNIELSQSSVVVCTDPDTGVQVEYAVLKSSNSHRMWTDLENIPVYLQYAFICTEDKDFYNEPGFNLKRTIGAMINEYILPIYSSKQGASTIEQQLIKNLTDDDSASGIEGALRKLREIYRAFNLYRNYSKSTILEAYLNTISFTGTIQGVQTASIEYFNKDVSELTLWECATIASITKNPTNYNPRTNPENLINRRNFLLYNMWDQGIITEEEYRNAAAQPLVLAEEDENTVSTTTSNNSYFTDALFQEVVKAIQEKEGVSEATAQNMLYTGGYTIEATVNPKIQSQMEQLMLNTGDQYFPAGWHEEAVSSLSDDDVPVLNADGTPKTTVAEDGTVTYYRNVRTQAAMVMLDYDGNVVAMVGGLGEKTKDLTLNRAYDVTRQTGSTIKPIGAYALGIEYGLVNWSTMLNNSPLYLKSDMIIRDDDYCRRNGLSGLSDQALKAYPNAWRSWPQNYGGNYGDNKDVPLWNGLARSLNTIAVRVGDLVGASTIFNFVYNTLQLDTLDPVNDVGLAPMVMGSQTHGVTPLALAAAFQIFYDGQYTTPQLYTRVLDRDGNIYLESNATSYQALTPQTATIMNQLLQNVLYSSVGTAAGRYPTTGGMRSFGKTGTASDEKDLWFVGGTPYYVTAVWWGYDAPYDMTKTLGSQAKTRTCVEAWKALMNTVQQGYEYKEFPMAEGVVQRSYCTESGLLASGACPSTAVGYYKADDLPAVCNYNHSGGIISSQEPDTTGIDTD
ncbi:transglycosylase domain-containing protein [Faecalibacterium gallinarum]|uniref:Penicillin-binding protein 1A n=1 Tax=Faecalibacterium gallinarum TaxID=2903556 RepID=A0AA37MYK4_9FIRM|nr:transglycosylase domain-containing protein [Faecalibacterium gallinarum]GJN64949.1 penicillin-binding protein 2A [Faecalibacterium gallinarum]